MKKNYLIGCGIQAFIIIASALLLPFTAISQNLTNAQRLERCQNNKNRIAELEQQLQVLNAELSQTMTKKEMEDETAKMLFIKKEKMKVSGPDNLKAVLIIFAQYNIDYYTNGYSKGVWSHTASLSELEKLIGKKIDKAMSLNRPALLAKRAKGRKN